MERMAWTDERIDDAVARIDRRFDGLHTEMREMKADLRGDIRELRAEMHSWQRQQAMIGWGIAAALMAQLIAFVITQS
jgi:hypothetical protein